MLLIDVGNTNLSCAYSVRGKIRKYLTYSKKSYKDEILAFVKEKGITTIFASSVVPSVSKGLRALSKKNKIKYLECATDITIPVKNLYDNPAEVGQDRLLNVYAVNKLYKDSDIRLVIDLGTALTFDFITPRGEYNGGLIFPGMNTSLNGLLSTCALLPDSLKLKPTKTLYAKTTIDGINNGIDYGYSFLISGMIEYLRKKKKHYKTLVTGGGAKLLIKDICKFDYYDDKLTLKGLNELIKETK